MHFFFLEILHWIWTSFFSFLMSLKIKKKIIKFTYLLILSLISIEWYAIFHWKMCNTKRGFFFFWKLQMNDMNFTINMEEKKISQNRNITYSDCVTWTFAITHLHFTHVKCNLQIFYFVNSCLVWIGSTITWKFSKNIMTKYLKPTNTPCLYVW